jgi:hypothetical protein
MDNQHRMISGYRELSEEDIQTVNALKTWEASWNRVCNQLRNSPDVDQRCVAIAATHIETGVMFAVKSITRPTRLVEGENTPAIPYPG